MWYVRPINSSLMITQYPWDITKKAWELGLLNGGIPQKFGGLGLGILDECIISEELAFGCTGITTAVAANGLAVSLSCSSENKSYSNYSLSPYLFFFSLSLFLSLSLSFSLSLSPPLPSLLPLAISCSGSCQWWTEEEVPWQDDRGAINGGMLSVLLVIDLDSTVLCVL